MWIRRSDEIAETYSRTPDLFPGSVALPLLLFSLLPASMDLDERLTTFDNRMLQIEKAGNWNLSSKNGDRARANKQLKKRRVARQQLRIIKRTFSPSGDGAKQSEPVTPLHPDSEKLL